VIQLSEESAGELSQEAETRAGLVKKKRQRVREKSTERRTPETTVWALPAPVLRDEIPPDAEWTKFECGLIHPIALHESHEIFEETQDHIIVHRVLNRREIADYIVRSRQIRREKRSNSKGEAPQENLIPLRPRRMRTQSEDQPRYVPQDYNETKSSERVSPGTTVRVFGGSDLELGTRDSRPVSWDADLAARHKLESALDAESVAKSATLGARDSRSVREKRKPFPLKMETDSMSIRKDESYANMENESQSSKSSEDLDSTRYELKLENQVNGLLLAWTR
jgi:hypothetical protein